MKRIQQVVSSALAVVLAAALAACGGGGDDAPSVSAEGSWSGALSGNTVANEVFLVVLDNGTYYGIYGDSSATYGMFQGASNTSGNSLTSGNGRDYAFGAGAAAAFSLNATVNPRTSLVGSASYSSPAPASVGFALSYDNGYNTPTTLADLAGTYSGSVGSLDGVYSASLTINGTGVLAGVDNNGCQVSGQLSRRGSTAVFDLVATLDAVTCGQAVSVQGIAGLTGVDRKTLAFAAVTPDRSDAVFGVVTKP